VDDSSAQLMALDIAKRIESELSYPSQIRVTVVRETRSVEYAK
jgi:ribonuclease Y